MLVADVFAGFNTAEVVIAVLAIIALVVFIVRAVK